MVDGTDIIRTNIETIRRIIKAPRERARVEASFSNLEMAVNNCRETMLFDNALDIGRHSNILTDDDIARLADLKLRWTRECACTGRS